MIKIIQINLRRMGTARSLLTQTARDRRADVLLFNEQPRGSPDTDRCRSSTNASSQIFITETAQLAVVEHFRGSGFVGINKGGLVIVSCYLPPSLTNGQYAAILGDLETELASFMQVSVVVGGDFNARVEEWGSDRTNRRGAMLREFVASAGLVAENRGMSPTYQSGESESVIDYTFSRMTAPHRVDG